MKTAEAFYHEIAESKELQEELKTVTEETLAAFLKKHGCGSTAEEFAAFVRTQSEGEIADEAAESVSGGTAWDHWYSPKRQQPLV